MDIDIWKYDVVSARAKAWMRKAKRQRPKTVGQYMDCFITSYVAYAAWVSLFRESDSIGHDRECCVNKVCEALASRPSILEELNESACELAREIDAKGFDVNSRNSENPMLSANWDEKNKSLSVLLSTLYNMRCNLFHGRKDLVGEQVCILRPAIRCLCVLNKALSEVFEEEYKEYPH